MLHDILNKDSETWTGEESLDMVKAVCEMIAIAIRSMDPKMVIEEWRQNHPEITDDDANTILESQLFQALSDKLLIDIINSMSVDDHGQVIVDEELCDAYDDKYNVKFGKSPALEEA